MKKAYIIPETKVYNLKANYELLQGSMRLHEDPVDTSQEGVQLGREEESGWGIGW